MLRTVTLSSLSFFAQMPMAEAARVAHWWYPGVAKAVIFQKKILYQTFQMFPRPPQRCIERGNPWWSSCSLSIYWLNQTHKLGDAVDRWSELPGAFVWRKAMMVWYGMVPPYHTTNTIHTTSMPDKRHGVVHKRYILYLCVISLCSQSLRTPIIHKASRLDDK